MLRAPAAARGERRRGNVTVWVVVCSAVILGILALGLDGGRMMEERRATQSAADAAALAAAPGRPRRIGLTLLKPSGDHVLNVSGNARVEVDGAPIVVNSDSGGEVYDIDDNGSVSADYHDLAGPSPPSGNVTGPVNTSVPSDGDPLESLPV